MFLGLDLGTSGVKAALLDETNGTIVAAATAPLTVSRPASGWSEQDPDDWLTATTAALDELKAGHGAALAETRGIGLSGQMHGAVLVDASDQPLRPCILWNDGRAWEEAAALDADPQFRTISGNIVFPGFTAPKLVWIRKHEPNLLERTEKVLLPKDYLRLWLTGEHAMDLCDASGTSWLDVGARRWSEPLLEASGMRAEQMPRLVDGSEASGALRADLAARWDMRAGIPVAGGAGDNGASAVGCGAIEDGSAFVSLGTSGVLLTAADAFRPSPETAVHTFCHAVPDRWIQMGVILSAAAALEWFAGIAGRRPADLTGLLGEALRAPGRTLFLPYLSGERTPHNDAALRGAFVGLGHETDPAAMTQAVLEGVAFALRENLDALRGAGGRLDRVIALGGGSRSTYWLKAVATALNLPVDLPEDGDYGAAFGAARLGWAAADGVDPTTAFTAPRIRETIEPDDTLKGAFEEALGRYQEALSAARL